jgi:hypothetical protein
VDRPSSMARFRVAVSWSKGLCEGQKEFVWIYRNFGETFDLRELCEGASWVLGLSNSPIRMDWNWMNLQISDHPLGMKVVPFSPMEARRQGISVVLGGNQGEMWWLNR